MAKVNNFGPMVQLTMELIKKGKNREEAFILNQTDNNMTVIGKTAKNTAKAS